MSNTERKGIIAKSGAGSKINFTERQTMNALEKLINKKRTTDAEECIIWAIKTDAVKEAAARQLSAYEKVAEIAKQIDYHKEFLPKGAGYLEEAIYQLAAALAELDKAKG